MVEFRRISTMGLNIKNAEVERLAAEIAAATGETKTEAIRKALLERKERLGVESGAADVRFLRERKAFFDRVPADQRQLPTRDEMDALNE